MEVSIYGCGSLGFQVRNLAERNGWDVKAFIDDNKKVIPKGRLFNLPILKIEDYILEKKLTNCILIAINDPNIRKKIKTNLDKISNFNYPSLVDKDAILLGQNTISDGSIIFPGTIIDINANIGTHCIINKLCSIGHDVEINDYVSISPMVMVGGKTIISENVFIGGSASLRENIYIAKNTSIGMGSVVVKTIKSGGLYFGNPALYKKDL